MVGQAKESEICGGFYKEVDTASDTTDTDFQSDESVQGELSTEEYGDLLVHPVYPKTVILEKLDPRIWDHGEAAKPRGEIIMITRDEKGNDVAHRTCLRRYKRSGQPARPVYLLPDNCACKGCKDGGDIQKTMTDTYCQTGDSYISDVKRELLKRKGKSQYTYKSFSVTHVALHIPIK